MDFLERKQQSLQIANLYQAIAYHHYASRIRDCLRFAQFKEKKRWLVDFDEFGEVEHVGESDPEWRLTKASFCRVRHCPVCQWRKSKRWQALALKSFPQIQQDYPAHRWLFLTLTVRNCSLKKLSSQIDRLNQSFAKWVKWKNFPAVGWLKSLEVSLNDDLAHPHFHILLLVSDDYFENEKKYLNQEQWQDSWRKAANLNYDPIIDIRAVGLGWEKTIIPELLKYTIKPIDLANINERNLFELTLQMHGVRAFNKGGILRKYFRNVGDDNIDLIGEKNDGAWETGYEERYMLDLNSYQYTYEFFYQNKQEHIENIDIFNYAVRA